MKYSFAAALLALPLALALTGSLKSVIVTYPKGTPEWVITQGKQSVVDSVRSAPLLTYGVLSSTNKFRGVWSLMSTVVSSLHLDLTLLSRYP